jgi:MFS family permease
MRLPAVFDVLRERNLARFAAATAVSALGNGMADIALAFAILGLGGPSELGVVFVAREIPLVALLLLGGVWADRISRKLILVSADLVRSAAQASIAVLLLTGTADLWKIVILQVAFGSANAFSRPAYTGLVQQLVRPEMLQRANALLGLARSPAQIAGPALGAVIVTAASPAWALAADATTFATSAALVLSLHLGRVTRGAMNSVLADLREGWKEFTSRTWVWTIVGYFGLYQLTLFPALLVLGPFVAKEQLGGAGAWGTILAIEAIGSVIGGVVALRVRFSRPLVALTLLAMPEALILLLLAVPAPVPVIAATAFVAAVCLTMGNVLWFSTLQRHIPEHAISRISSFDWLGSVVFNPIGYVLVGPLSGLIGVPQTLVLAGSLNIVFGLVLLTVRSVRSLGEFPSAAEAEESVASKAPGREEAASGSPEV